MNDLDVESQGGSTERTEVAVPANYKLRLAGSKLNPYQPGTTDIDLVVTEGQFKNRHIFASLPAPDKQAWAPKAAAILVKRLGGEFLPGEELVDTLKRIAANGNAQITADFAADTYTKDGVTKTKPKLQFFSIAAAV